MASKKRENKRKATIKKFKTNKYYYAFVAVVLIIAILVVGLDYKFRFGLIDWAATGESSEESQSNESYEQTFVDELGDLTVKFIDVGQGDAIFIIFPDGKTMLIDAGKNTNSAKTALDENLIVNGQKAVLDYVVATHSDDDHIGSMPYVYENYQVNKSYRPYTKAINANAESFTDIFNKGYTEKASKIYYEYLLGVQNENTPCEFFYDGSDFQTVANSDDESISYKVDFVMPYAKTLDGFNALGKNVNDPSAIIIIEFAGKKIMFTGDIEEKAEEAFVSYYEQNSSEADYLDVDVLKVAHHGSDTSSSFDFLSLVKPEHVVISCGIGNSYQHPCDEALNNIIGIQSTLNVTDGKPIYRTDLHGTVVLTVTAEGEMTFTVETTENDEFLLYNGTQIAEVENQIIKP